MKDTDQTKAQLEARLAELERDHDLAKQALSKGFIASIIAMFSGMFTLFGVVFALVYAHERVLTGTDLVLTFAIIAGAIVVYFSFVFGRVAKLKIEITKTRKLIEIASGDKAK